MTKEFLMPFQEDSSYSELEQRLSRIEQVAGRT